MIDRETILEFDRFLQAAYERGNCWQYDRITDQTIGELIQQAHSFERWHHRTFPPIDIEGSQGEEDEIIAELFPGGTGVYIDIGAGDPVSCSNTWHLYKHGWRGLLVEPHPDYVQRLIAKRPHDRVYPVAASDRTGWALFRVLRSLSSLRADWEISEQCRAFVRTERTDKILQRFNWLRDVCDLCSIDVEGHERQVLEAIDWYVFRPSVIVIEYKKFTDTPPHDDLTHEWEPILLAQGYRFHRATEFNKFYVLVPDEEDEADEEEEAMPVELEPVA